MKLLTLRFILFFFVHLFINQVLAQNVQPTRPYNTPIYSSVLGIGSEPVLFTDVNLTSYEIINTSVIFSEKNQMQKMVFMPLLFKTAWDNSNEAEGKQNYWQEGFKINLAHKEGVSTVGIGLDIDRTKSKNAKFIEDYNRAYGTVPTLTSWLRNFMTNLEIDAVNKNDTTFPNFDQVKRKHEKLKKSYEQREAIHSARAVNKALEKKWKSTIGLNLQFFEVIGGTDVDLDADSLIDNKYSVKGVDASASFMYVASKKVALNFVARHQNKRSSSVEKQKLVPYLGGSFNFAWRVVEFGSNIVKEDESTNKTGTSDDFPSTIYEYELSDNFQNKFFVPSWYFGFSIETNNAIGNKDFAEDDLISQHVLTPFFDFKISPASQFRIAIPIKLNNKNDDKAPYGPYLQWNFQLVNLN